MSAGLAGGHPILAQLAPQRGGVDTECLGRLGAITAVALIKAHRAALEELAALRVLHKLVADNATDLVTRHDRNGLINFASPAAEALLGVSSSLLVRRGLTAAMSAGNAARCQDANSSNVNP